MKVSGPAVLWKRSVSDGAVRSFIEAYDVLHARLAAKAQSDPVFAAHLEMLEDPMVTETVPSAGATSVSSVGSIAMPSPRALEAKT